MCTNQQGAKNVLSIKLYSQGVADTIPAGIAHRGRIIFSIVGRAVVRSIPRQKLGLVNRLSTRPRDLPESTIIMTITSAEYVQNSTYICYASCLWHNLIRLEARHFSLRRFCPKTDIYVFFKTLSKCSTVKRDHLVALGAR